jgi:hypothetical protein
MRWAPAESVPLLEELLPERDRWGGAMMYFLIAPAHLPADGLRGAFREHLKNASPKEAHQYAFALGQIGSPEDRDCLQEELERIRRRNAKEFSAEDCNLEAELVAALLKVQRLGRSEQKSLELQRSCRSEQCKQRFRAQ